MLIQQRRTCSIYALTIIDINSLVVRIMIHLKMESASVPENLKILVLKTDVLTVAHVFMCTVILFLVEKSPANINCLIA